MQGRGSATSARWAVTGDTFPLQGQTVGPGGGAVGEWGRPAEGPAAMGHVGARPAVRAAAEELTVNGGKCRGGTAGEGGQ
eukprot:1989658-Pleurochrysis_carterae.AAC.2